jgi:hypothetical protein
LQLKAAFFQQLARNFSSSRVASLLKNPKKKHATKEIPCCFYCEAQGNSVPPSSSGGSDIEEQAPPHLNATQALTRRTE